ncbi:MAG: DUF481 domain-containing protein [Gemmatimonadetes bacterium]|nr:DUF481 domain-containing protein [Gemmatimonadota bacterium]
MHRSLTTLTTLLLLAAPAAAQDPPSERWAFELGLALNSAGGNQDLTAFTSTLELTHLQKESFELGFNGGVRYGRSGGEDVAQNMRATLNFDFRPEARWTPFLFASGEKDPFRKLDLRFNGGAGAKRTFWRDGWSEVSLSGAALYSHENLELAVPGDEITRTARWSWRARGRHELSDRSRFEQVFFYQPEWRHAGDYLLESFSSIRLGITRSLALNLTFLYERDSTPAPDVDPDDWSLATGVNLTTRW